MGPLDQARRCALQAIVHCRLVDGSAAEVVARLGRRPAPWLRPFLQLAAQPWHAEGADHWFRIGPFDRDQRARFVWHPHGTPELFASFTGTFAVGRSAEGIVLVLSGRAKGGTTEVNTQAVESLLGLLVEAVAASADAQPSG